MSHKKLQKKKYGNSAERDENLGPLIIFPLQKIKKKDGEEQPSRQVRGRTQNDKKKKKW